MADLFDDTLILKTISLWQPWASLHAAGFKRHETRHWPTSHTGLVAIHAAKRLDVVGAPEQLCRHAFGPKWRTELPRGCIVAVGMLVACRPTEEIVETVTAADYAAGNFTPGRYAWTIDDIRTLRIPIPTAGRQGLFNWRPPAGLDNLLGPSLDHAAIAQTFNPLSRVA